MSMTAFPLSQDGRESGIPGTLKGSRLKNNGQKPQKGYLDRSKVSGLDSGLAAYISLSAAKAPAPPLVSTRSLD